LTDGLGAGRRCGWVYQNSILRLLASAGARD
jgi:hypothetical protein